MLKFLCVINRRYGYLRMSEYRKMQGNIVGNTFYYSNIILCTIFTLNFSMLFHILYF